MEQYQEFSHYYDELTMDHPYEMWLDIVKTNVNDKASILDIGCGTGSLTHRMTELGSVTGMDLSPEMLAIASQKSNDVRWIEGDMADFDLGQTYDVITIFCDSLNYLRETEDVMHTFQLVHSHLTDDGVFIFDVHSVHKMHTKFYNQSYIDETEHVFLGWDAVSGDEPNSVWHYLTFFESRENGTYQRFDEEHYQRTYSEQEYRKMLNDAGYSTIKSFYDFDETNHESNSDRLFFIVNK